MLGGIGGKRSNNLTTEEHPSGLYHPHEHLHHIKKENIGLIEVMGLAVLPSRLKAEMAAVADALVSGRSLVGDENTEKHAEWAAKFINDYEFTKENVTDILNKEIGKTFVEVLKDAGVYKTNEEGYRAFDRYIAFAGGYEI